MGRSFAFKEFRKERLLSNNPLILVTKLDKYSEKGSKYGEALTSIITYNKFLEYDKKTTIQSIENSITKNEDLINSNKIKI